MRTDIKKLNNWFSRHGWHRDNRGYEQYLWKGQETCFITHFDGKEYRQINETTILIWPSAEKISVTNRSFWMSSTGDKMECSVGQGFSYALTPEELSKIKELYDALNNELQTARGNMMFDMTEIREKYCNRSLMRELDWVRNYPPRGMSKMDTEFIRWLADAAYERIKEAEAK